MNAEKNQSETSPSDVPPRLKSMEKAILHVQAPLVKITPQAPKNRASDFPRLIGKRSAVSRCGTTAVAPVAHLDRASAF